MKVALVHSGGDEAGSPDEEDTLKQVQELSEIFGQMDFETISIPCQNSLGAIESALEKFAPSFIFNLVESAKKTDRLFYTAAALFEFMGIPYTGCSAPSLALLSSKIAQKKLMLCAGLPTATFWEYPSDIGGEVGPFIVKTESENASIGLGSENVVETLAQAFSVIEEKKKNTGIKNWFVERFIEGREFNVGILGGKDGHIQVLPIAEILFVDFPKNMPKIVDYAAKWDESSFGYKATIRNFDFVNNEELLLNKLKKLSLQCWDLFGLNGAGRVDFRVDGDGNPWILEVNPNPCLSSDAGFMVAAQRANLSPQDVVQRLVSLLNR